MKKSAQKFHVEAMACAEHHERPDAKGNGRIGDFKSRSFPVKFPKKKQTKTITAEQQNKVYANTIQGGSQVLHQSYSITLQYQPCGSSFCVIKEPGIKRLWNLSVWLRKSIEARCVAEKSLNVGPEKLLHKA